VFPSQIIKEVKLLLYEGWPSTLWLFSLGKRSLRGSMTEVYKIKQS